MKWASGTAWRGVGAWYGVVWRGMAWHGLAWRGVAWGGMSLHAAKIGRDASWFVTNWRRVTGDKRRGKQIGDES